jgi:hypothetical protein
MKEICEVPCFQNCTVQCLGIVDTKRNKKSALTDPVCSVAFLGILPLRGRLPPLQALIFTLNELRDRS